jgi:hypothetical protein
MTGTKRVTALRLALMLSMIQALIVPLGVPGQAFAASAPAPADSIPAQQLPPGVLSIHTIPPRSRAAVIDTRAAAVGAEAGVGSGSAPLQPAPSAAAAPAATTIHLQVQSARTQTTDAGTVHQGDAVAAYQWLIVADDTGNPDQFYGASLPAGAAGSAAFDCTPQSNGGDPSYPANCQWPSIHSVKGGTSAEVFAEGDQSTLNTTTGLDLPPGRYMISVTADGFKVDGTWFSIPTAGANSMVTVQMQPYPLPLTTVRLKVWEDLNTNGAYDEGEPPLVGWQGQLNEIMGLVFTDWFGNPICTTYQHDGSGMMVFDVDGKPVIDQPGGKCLSDADGVITIPYLGPSRYAATVTPPAGETWYQTSTLEGGHDWDTWAMNGWDGFDPEFIVGKEPFPFAQFGFVRQTSLPGHPDMPTSGGAQFSGVIKGQSVADVPYTPVIGGVAFGGEAGMSTNGPVPGLVVALVDTLANDTNVFVGAANADGSFAINGVPDGDYVLALWDEPQNYLLVQFNVRVTGGQVVDLGSVDLYPWFGNFTGKVCLDENRNARCDPGEKGIPDQVLQILDRDNSIQDQGIATVTTDNSGNYLFNQTYPLGQWMVMQAYYEQYYTVGITYQALNQPAETTVIARGGFVDISIQPQVGQIMRVDWAIHPYETDPAVIAQGYPANGGIVGEAVYNTTIAENPAKFNSSQDNEPGIPDLTMHLYWPVKCDPAADGGACKLFTTSFGSEYYLTNPDGTLQHGPEAMPPYTTETWRRPVDCVARDVNMNPVVEQVLPPATGGHECLEAPMMGEQVSNNSLTDAFGVTGDGQYVNGNYGFTTIMTDSSGQAIANGPVSIPAGDWIVTVESPVDAASGKPLWRATMEEDLNLFAGDEEVPPGEVPSTPPTPAQQPFSRPAITPQIPPFLCVGPQHLVHVVNDHSQAHFDVTNPSTATLSSGVYNPSLLDNGGSPYEGQNLPLCNEKLVTVRQGRSATPNFYMQPNFNVPLPGRILGLVVDDLNVSANPKELYYGEKAGIPNLPIGIYDFANRLMTTVNTDRNGVFEVLLPSTTSFNCPIPSGICPGVYRFLANDPGVPGHLNPNYNPQYRTIGVFNQVWPGITTPADLAPVPAAGALIQGPGFQTMHPPACLLNDPAQVNAPRVPEFFSVDHPNVGMVGTFTINGVNFGASQGAQGQVTLDTTSLNVLSWSDTQIQVSLPAVTLFNYRSVGPGPHNLRIRAGNGFNTVNGLTMHVTGTISIFGIPVLGYTPQIYTVGPGASFTFNSADPDPSLAMHAVQRALDAAAATNGSKLVVVYPNAASTFNPSGVYYENVIIHSPVKLQGVGPGGVIDSGGGAVTYVPGSILDGTGIGQDNTRSTDWLATLTAVGAFAQPGTTTPAVSAVPDGEVVLVLATTSTQFTSGYKAAIDGFTIQNGDVADFVVNRNGAGGGPVLFGTAPADAATTQGGGIFAYAWTRYLQITNNILRSNTGSYGSAVRLGTPQAGDNHLDGAHLAFNRIIANGGANLAGGVAVFAGAAGYEINNNQVCGNYSAEYGGGISHFGYSSGGSIHDNRIYFNTSYDEAGGVMIAGEPAANLSTLSPGSGAVNIYNNIIQSNLSNDDGGGLRFLMAGNFPMNVYNNFIVNNVSTHEGGGMALDDAPNVRFYNNTVMRNLTTATAATSDGQPAPAGLSTMLNSYLLQATLPAGSPNFSRPLLFNNIFWDNRAGRWDGANVTGIGGTNLLGQVDPSPINPWDMANVDNPSGSLLQPTYSVLNPTSNPGVQSSATNRLVDPQVFASYDTSILAIPFRGNARFVGSVTIALDVPTTIMGNYHLASQGSPAVNGGSSSQGGVSAPNRDIDNEARPMGGGYDIGGDEIPPSGVPGVASIFADILDAPTGMFTLYMPAINKTH